MPQIIILPHHELCPEGIVIEAQAGETVCSAMLANDVEIEHACEMSNACTTCHIYVREGFDSLAESDETEDDMLDKRGALIRIRACLANQFWVIQTWWWRFQSIRSIKYLKTIKLKFY